MIAVEAPVREKATVTFSLEDASPFEDGKFEGWGTSFCWWPNRIGYSQILTEEAARLFFDPEEGLGLNIIRYNIGGGDDPSHAHITRTDSMVPGYAVDPVYENGTYDWGYDWSADENQRNVLLKVAEKYSENLIVEGFSNSPPYFMTNSGCSSGAEDASKNNLRDDAYDAFAAYLADVAVQFDEEWGIRFQSMTAMNEPETNYWHAFSDKQEGCHFDGGESQSRMILALRAALDERGLSDIQISGTDETGINIQLNTFYQLSEEAKAAITRIDTHSYQSGPLEALKKTAVKAGKNLWMSEVDGGDTAGEHAGEMGAGLWLAKKILQDMNGMTPSAWILWQVIDNHISQDGYMGNQDSGMVDLNAGYWGLAVADHDREEILLTMKYYAMGQFTRYIRPNDTIIAGDDRTLAAWNEEEKRLVVVAVNDTAGELAYTFGIEAFGLGGASVQTIRTSGSIGDGEHWKQLEPQQTDKTQFDTVLKANSVTTFVFRASSVTE